MAKSGLGDPIKLIFSYLFLLLLIAIPLLLLRVWETTFLVIINIIFIIAGIILEIGLLKCKNWARVGIIIWLSVLIFSSLFLISFKSKYYFLTSLGAVILFSIIPIIIIRYLLKHKLEHKGQNAETSKEMKQIISSLITYIVFSFLGLIIFMIINLSAHDPAYLKMSIDLDTRTVSLTREVKEPKTFEECINMKSSIINNNFPKSCIYENLLFLNPEDLNKLNSER